MIREYGNCFRSAGKGKHWSMRYGILEYKNPNIINIGDGMQIISVLNLYRQWGVDEKEIIRVSYFDLETYDGEEVLLPICFPMYGYNMHNHVTCWSSKIIPVFLSLSLFDTNLSEADIEYLKRFEPIGCRDAFTAEGLQKCGVRAYLNGCITLTLDGERNAHNGKKVFLIDVPEEFEQCMPEELRTDVCRHTHIFHRIGMRTDEYARKLMEQYEREASIVITGRMHAALPCYSAGLPVIFVHPEWSYRFTWLEDVLPVYLPEERKKIEWSGSRIADNEKALKIRAYMKEIAKVRVMDREEPDTLIETLQELYAGRTKRDYVRGPYDVTVDYLREHWNEEIEAEYMVWGVSQVASALIGFIRVNYPKAKLTGVIDASKTESFKGLIPQKIETVTNIGEIFVFVTADAVNPYALDYFRKIGKPEDSSFFCWEHISVGEGTLPIV